MGLRRFFDQLAHLVGGVLFLEGQLFGEADAIAPEESHQEQAAHLGIVQDKAGAVRK